MTYQEFIKGMIGETLAYAENLVGQRDDAITRIAAHDENVAKLKSEHDAVIAAKNEEIATAQKLVDMMGGTEIGQQLAKQKQIDELTATKEKAMQDMNDADAKLKALNNVSEIQIQPGKLEVV